MKSEKYWIITLYLGGTDYMKPLNNTDLTESINTTPTDRQKLILELMVELHPTDTDFFLGKVNEVLSKYEVRKCDLTSIQLELPKDLVGKTVNITNSDRESWDFTGEIIDILYRDTAYDFTQIRKLLDHPDMSEEQREMMKLTIYEETRPKIYHRLVLNDVNKGIILVPYLVGVNMKQE